MRTFTPLGIALWLAAGSTATAQDHFDTWASYDTGTAVTARHPYDVESADFDGDGDQDLAVVNWWSFPKLGILFNDGNGSYSAPELYAGKPGYDLESADLDGDGHLDIVTANAGSSGSMNSVSVYMNEGGGTFAAPQTFQAGGKEPTCLTLDDFDADGAVDIAVALHGNFSTSITVLRNTGGGFAAPVAYTAGPNVGGWTVAPYAIESGDLNGDNLPDIVVGNDGMWVSILLNTGDSFAPAVYIDLDMGPIAGAYPSLLVEDVDQDGDLDVMYSNHLTETYIYNPGFMQASAVGLLRNDGAGNFPTVPEELGIMGGKPGFAHMYFEDVTGDGWKDIMGVFQASGGWSVVPSDGAGGFLFGIEYVSGDEPMAITSFDVEGDGDNDVVVVSRETLEAAVHENPGNGDFDAVKTYQAGYLTNRNHDVGDVDQDGALDVVVGWASNNNGGVDVLLNLGGGVLAPQIEYPSTQGVAFLKLRDLNGDEWPDLVWADDTLTPPYSFKTRLNDGDGTFGPQQNWAVGTCGTYDMQCFDVDGDGDNDVLLGEYLACFGSLNKYMHIRLNNGNGTFAPPYKVLGDTMGVRSIAGADFDNDGNMDVAATTAGQINVFPGKGDGTFFPYLLVPLPGYAAEMRAADVNGDGNADLAIVASDPAITYGLAVLLGNGDMTFQPPAYYAGSYNNSVAIDVGDPDLDGDVDIMLANHSSATFSFFENKGDGTFERQIRYGAGGGMTDLRFADVTGDGVGDVIGLMGRIGSLYSNGSGVSVVPGTNESGPTAYCTPGTSASGCNATLAYDGSPSASATSGFTLYANGVEGGKNGLYFFGTNGRQANSWGSGTSYQCVAPPVNRAGLLTGVGTNAACDGAFDQDLNALWCSTCPKPGKNPGAGAVVQAQLWYRDPNNTSNRPTSLSDAIEFQVAP
jgi:hypothetical protein